MSLGVYQPSDTVIHRASPGLKLTVLAAYAVGLSMMSSTLSIVLLAASAAAAWFAAGFSAQRLLLNLRPMLWILLALSVFQCIAAGVVVAAHTALTLMALVTGAALVSHTTRTDDMLECLTMALSPFARLGVKPENAAFALVFTVRLVPFVSGVGREAIQARLARGAGRNNLAALVPMVIRLMRETDALSEALVARGFGRT